MEIAENNVSLPEKNIHYLCMKNEKNRNSVIILDTDGPEGWKNIHAFEKMSEWGFDIYYPYFPDEYRSGSSDAGSHFVYDFIKVLSLRNSFLIGDGAGGEIALKFAIDHPEKTGNIVVIGATGLNDLKYRLSQVNKPTMIIWGRRDEKVNPAAGESFHDLIAGSVLKMIDGGHSVQFQKSDIFFSYLKPFFLDH